MAIAIIVLVVGLAAVDIVSDAVGVTQINIEAYQIAHLSRPNRAFELT